MELNEKLNNSYKKDKNVFSKVSKLEEKLKDAKKQIKALERTKEDAQLKKQRAVEDKDKAAEKNADAAVELASKEIKKIKSNVEKMTKILKENKEKVDSYISELSKDPEFEAHMNSIIEKRYNRKIKVEMDEKEQVDLIIDACEKHPTLENNIKGMVKAKEELDKLNDELGKLDPVKDKKRVNIITAIEIPNLVDKKEKNKTSFMTICQKNKIQIDEKNLDKIINEQGFSHDKEGNINAMKSLKNMSKGYEKTINTYKTAVQKIPGAKVYETNQEKDSHQEKRTMGGNEQEDSTENNNLPDTKYKWYEFRKRFSAWKSKKSVEKEEKKQEKEEKKNEGKTKTSKKFKDAYKYDIVKDYVDKKQEDLFKEAAKETKAKNKAEKKDKQEEKDEGR